MLKYLCEKEYFPDNCVRIWKGVTPCLLCASVKVTSLLYAEKIPSEYSNNRNPLMSKMVDLDHGQFALFSVHLEISIVLIFMLKYPREKENFPDKCVRVGKSVTPCLLRASIEVTSLLKAKENPFWIFKQ